MPDITHTQALEIIANAFAMRGKPAEGAPPVPPPPTPTSKYGPHNPSISNEQAHVLQMLMLVTGQSGNTVGRGHVMSLADYMSDEKKKADNDHSGDGFSSLPLKDQRTYIDGVNSGAITEGPRLWQERVQQNIDKQRQDAGIIRDVYGDEMDPAINGAPSNVAGPAGPTPGRNTQITGRGGAARME